MLEGSSRRLRVVLDARVPDGLAGGVQQWVIGLANAFSALEADGDEYLFLVDAGREGWLTPFVRGPARVIRTARPPYGPSLLAAARGRAAEVPGARSAFRRLKALVGGQPTLAVSDGTIERAGADVVHFTFQKAFITAVPSLYQPWDLQHLHLPQFFTPQERARREFEYRAFCEQAETVITATNWVKRDIVSQYGLHPERIAVVNVPPVTTAYPPVTAAEAEAVRKRLAVPGEFLYYPAQAWPHKNHSRLLSALGRLRREGLRIPLVCSGQRNEHHRNVLRAARDAGVHEDVYFVGFVPPADVEALYRSARALVFPSLYEGWGLPIVEAFRAGLPVACSNATSLPELVGDAALVFDPLDEQEIATAIRRLWTDRALATTLAQSGRRRVERFNWRDTALTLRAHYRSVAGRRIDDHDRQLLSVASTV